MADSVRPRRSESGSPLVNASVLTAPAQQRATQEMASRPSPVDLWSDRLLDAVMVGTATWTVVYHLCLVMHWGVAAATLLEVAALVAVVVAVRLPVVRGLRTGPEPGGESGWPRWRGHVGGYVTAAGAVGTALLTALEAWWPLVAAGWVLTAALGTFTALTRRHPDNMNDPDDAEDPVDPAGSDRLDGGVGGRTRRAATASALVPLAWGLVLAALSVSILRSNPDDVYYVNLSQWTAEHGAFPLRDSIFSDLVYPMTSWPPMASYDALAGAVAHLLDARAATIVYQVVPPMAALLVVLAMGRLLRIWRVPAAGLVLSVGMAFLLLDGAAPYSPGNLIVTRLWQGKIIYLGLVVPLLLVYAARYVSRPTPSSAAWLVVGGVAGVGFTTSAMFLTPLLAVAAMAPLVRTRWRAALIGVMSLAAYPVGASIVTFAVDGRSADDFERATYRFAPSWFGPYMLSHGVIAFVAVAAVLVGCLLLPRRADRITLGLLALLVGLTFVPGVTRLSFDLTGIGPTLWRVAWLVPIALVVGVVTVRLLHAVDGRMRAVAAVVAIALLVMFGKPVWTSGSTEFLRPFHDQRPVATVEMTKRLISSLDDGDVVLASQGMSITIAVTTTSLTTVSPRDYFLDPLRHATNFHYPARVALSSFVNSDDAWVPRQVTRALRVVSVDAVCLDTEQTQTGERLHLLTSAGYQALAESPTYVCLAR